ncbi:hypothetical protein Golax_022739 [Gossypium laxum]|uniref:Uncharacterized protein n=1 Tax=Gossypium laxum TaxID=34288 RepID=A0A7J9AYH8_9ROSI|nr:hypothetical protein [Gossypium laxum]
MATSLIHFDGKYISTTQVVMADDRALEGIIHYLAMPLITELRGYLLVIIRSTIIPNKKDLCAALLGKVATTPSGLQIMRKAKLGTSCVGHIVPGVVLGNEIT